MKIERVLGIETSCDDTSVAIVKNDGFVEALQSANQDKFHAPFGGIVPEIAGRNHSETLLPLIDQVLTSSGYSWKDIDGIAVTSRPGLIGSLIVGVVTAKSLSQTLQKPLIGVNHLEGHIVAPFLRDQKYQPSFSMNEPFIALAVSGGHTTLYQVSKFTQYKILGRTLDDAAGEAFDKFAKMVGLGFPGGVAVDRLALDGDANAYAFPRAMLGDSTFDMSFSGLKSASHRLLEKMSAEDIKAALPNLCASFQKAVVDVLIEKMDRVVKATGCKHVVVTGGVSANSELRSRSQAWAQQKGLQILIPPMKYCTDNAAMIALAGVLRLNQGLQNDLHLAPAPASLASDFQ